MTTPLATIVFLPREQFSTTRRSLDTLYERTKDPFELVCIDGGSPPEVQQYLEQAARQREFTLLRTDTYLTPNQARNLALPHVANPYVVFVDNDVLVAPGWLSPMVECAEETGAWVVGPLYFEFEPECKRLHMFGGECRIEDIPDIGRDYVERHRFAHQLLEDVPQPLARTETELIEFHTVLVSMEAFRQLGPLDEGFLCSSEHSDLCLTVRSAGQRVFLEPRSQITYVPPKHLSAADLEFFRLRWSEARNTANIRHLQQKWNLAPNTPGLADSQKWVAGHRRYVLRGLSRLRRVVGRKLAASIEKRLVAPLESAANRRQFPPTQYGHITSPDVRIVYSPHGLKDRAA